MKKALSGWGRYPVVEAELFTPSTVGEVQRVLRSSGVGRFTPRGLGRSYGDSSLGHAMLSSARLAHFLSFDDLTGLLHCGAGVSLNDILEVFVPKGWFLPVTPGTRFVTVGGAIASDVHGKNHHVSGCFCDHVEFLDICLDADRVVRCSPRQEPDLFRATCGGMGLTGMVISAAIRMKRIGGSFIDQTTYKAGDLGESLDLFDAHADKPYSVAWIDCLAQGDTLGRSLLMIGDHAAAGELRAGPSPRISMPVDMPSALLNPFSIRAFNELYYQRIRKSPVNGRVHYAPFFYPLDSIGEWNRMYGRQGFTQYQFVIPKGAGREAMASILRRIAESGKGSFLAVLKAFGKQNANLLSFPMEGYTLALDFKIEKSLFPLLEKLDAMVLDYGGRLYLTKDARMSGETFRRGYPGWERFREVRERYGVLARFQSMQSRRMGIDQ
jgi:FAD/FMN-containing dehydrogenase